jgi:hypothetical protein
MLNILRLRAAHCLTKNGYLVDTGWIRSFNEKRAVDKHGNPIPWITYPALDFIKTKVNNQMSVFEFGSGASTKWWSQHVKLVDAVEHDPKWFDIVANSMPNNVKLQLCTDDKYFTQINTTGNKYDIVIIDGQDRNRCTVPAMAALTSKGIIIWDDSERDEYQPSFELLRQAGFKRLFFTGLSPIYNDQVETTIFYRNDNCMGI